jgi:hypothetical protein
LYSGGRFTGRLRRPGSRASQGGLEIREENFHREVREIREENS